MRALRRAAKKVDMKTSLFAAVVSKNIDVVDFRKCIDPALLGRGCVMVLFTFTLYAV